MEPILMGAIVLFFFTRSVFYQKPSKPDKAKDLGNALVDYLEYGVKVRQ
ncbi:MAG: hypothetical protein AAGI69_04060 [Cyanobacteria bacterium P01_H01_bin.21]